MIAAVLVKVARAPSVGAGAAYFDIAVWTLARRVESDWAAWPIALYLATSPLASHTSVAASTAPSARTAIAVPTGRGTEPDAATTVATAIAVRHVRYFMCCSFVRNANCGNAEMPPTIQAAARAFQQRITTKRGSGGGWVVLGRGGNV